MSPALKLFWINLLLLVVGLGIFGSYDETKIIVGGISMNIWGAVYVLIKDAKLKEGE